MDVIDVDRPENAYTTGFRILRHHVFHEMRSRKFAKDQKLSMKISLIKLMILLSGMCPMARMRSTIVILLCLIIMVKGMKYLSLQMMKRRNWLVIRKLKPMLELEILMLELEIMMTLN